MTLARALATKIVRGDRTATSRCRQVPSLSSAANASPATTEVSNGSPQLHAKASTTKDPAHPLACIQRPKTVSVGRDVWALTAATKPAGATRHTRSTTRSRHWVSSLVSSKR